jgi:hypothetical protein
MQVERPEDVRVKLDITMTVGQWDVIIGTLNAAIKGEGVYRSDVAALRNAIEDATTKIRARVCGESVALIEE